MKNACLRQAGKLKINNGPIMKEKKMKTKKVIKHCQACLDLRKFKFDSVQPHTCNKSTTEISELRVICFLNFQIFGNMNKMLSEF